VRHPETSKATATSATNHNLNRMGSPGLRPCLAAGPADVRRKRAYIIHCAKRSVEQPKIERQDLENFGAGEGIRTLDPDLGKVV
jgi:hypothetical protein